MYQPVAHLREVSRAYQQRRAPRVIFINRYFFPDHSATSQLVSDLAFHLATLGWDVHAITSRQKYDDACARFPAEETADGVHIHRVNTSTYGRSGLLGRSLDYLSFCWSMARALNRLAGSADVVVAMTDPPLLSVVPPLFRPFRSFRVVNWLQDLYPELAAKLHVPLLRGVLGRMLLRLRNWSLSKADANVVLGSSMEAQLMGVGAKPERVRIIPNWTDDESITPQTGPDNPLREEWELTGKFVIGYSGNLGRAHDFDTVLAAAETLRSSTHFVFMMIGGGAQFDLLSEQVRERGLTHLFRFFPYQSSGVLSFSLGVADAHWISLRPELEGWLFPSKFYGVGAAGRPIIAVTGRDGELARLIREHRCGYVVEQGDAAAMTKAITELASDPTLCAEMGRRAREMLDANFTRKQALARWESVLTELAQRR